MSKTDPTENSDLFGAPIVGTNEECPPSPKLPILIITGASGFVGRHILDHFKEDFRIVGLARRSQRHCGAPIHSNISWYQVDLGDREALARAFKFIKDTGGADYVIHLAAHYDFTGNIHPEYKRTSVDGMRNLLEECRDLDLKRFIFASSIVACGFPRNGKALTEESPADGEHVYAITKGIGEKMLAEYDDEVPSCIIRLAALFSDWCEYAPLYVFLETWLSAVWNKDIIGGRGTTALPYLHVREIGPFIRQVLHFEDMLNQREVLIASPSETLSHVEIFNLANIDNSGRRRRPIFIPKPLAGIGVWIRDLLGRLLGNRPFERPWMIRYLDTDLTVDPTHTYKRLNWKPKKRLLLQRRMPFMVEHRKTDPGRWCQLNRVAMKEFQVRENLRINRLLEKHLGTICVEFLDHLLSPESESLFPSYQNVSRDDLEWRFMILLRQLQNSIRALDQGLFMTYCRDLAERRLDQGFGVREVVGCLLSLNSICVDILRSDDEAQGLDVAISDHLSVTIRFGCDQIFEVYEEVSGEEFEEEL